MSNGQSDVVRVATCITVSTFIEQVDSFIVFWKNFPDAQVKTIVEVAKEQGLFMGDGGDKAVDMLMTRVQCAEEFKRVAEEYANLLTLGLETEMGEEPHA
jgi:hypothetical protein